MYFLLGSINVSARVKLQIKIRDSRFVNKSTMNLLYKHESRSEISIHRIVSLLSDHEHTELTTTRSKLNSAMTMARTRLFLLYHKYCTPNWLGWPISSFVESFFINSLTSNLDLDNLTQILVHAILGSAFIQSRVLVLSPRYLEKLPFRNEYGSCRTISTKPLAW